jgi:very-short-patch-repair endonuclease
MNPINRCTIESVKLFFEREGYTLLSKSYKNSHTKLTYLCPKGHEGLMAWTTFKSGHRCYKCSYEIRRSKNKKDLEEIKQYIEQQGYQCLTQYYTNNKQKLDLICPKGHKWFPNWNRFQMGCRCVMCAGKAKRNIEEIQEYVKRFGYQVISKVYTGTHNRIELVCPQGHSYSTRWNDFQQGYRCPECREWKNEKKLGEILERVFPNKVRHLDNLDFLGRQRVDYSIRDMKLVFEYDGKQHFEPVRFGNVNKQEAKRRFKRQQEWDKRKNKLCQENGYHLIRVAYSEKLTMERIIEKISSRSNELRGVVNEY